MCAVGLGGGEGGSPGPDLPTRRGDSSPASSSVAEVATTAPRPCVAVVEGRQRHPGFVRAWWKAGGGVVGLANEGGVVGPNNDGGVVFFLSSANFSTRQRLCRVFDVKHSTKSPLSIKAMSVALCRVRH